ncbi:MAG: hypothetical protein R6U58_12510 [Bacteroidales bacterium]
MDKDQVFDLMNSGSLPGSQNQAEMKETHISWIILTDHYAFKIKRPVKYSFLDFSSLEKRRHYCHEELKLNQRLAPDMYLTVLPVTGNMLNKTRSGEKSTIIDYAVQMKRMDNKKEMDNMLKTDKVSDKHIIKLAEKIARFHQSANVIKNKFDTAGFQEKYKDIKSVIPNLKKKSMIRMISVIEQGIDKSKSFLTDREDFLNNRIKKGFHRDCHGDLNSRNIFVYEDPVIFDCIEFNKEYRHIDVLNDIAFLCVDLDYFGKSNFSELFYKKYLEYTDFKDNADTRQLFTYYKSYRANVRAKVTLISASKTEDDKKNKALVNDAVKYLELMKKYTDLTGC